LWLAEGDGTTPTSSGIREEWIDGVTKEIKKEIAEEVKGEIVNNVKKHSSSFAVIAGATLIIIGILFLFPHFHFRYLLPIALIALGIALLFAHNKKN